MRLIQNPTLFHASDTVMQCASKLLETRWRRWLLHACGGVGYTAVTVLFVLKSLTVGDHVGPSTSAAATALAVTGLCATTLSSLVYMSCCQRGLLRKLFTSFDFVFFYAQLLAEHLCACEVFQWPPVLCCGVPSNFLWMHCVLTLDALTPAMKAPLGLKSWRAAAILLLNLGKSVLIALEVFVWRRVHVDNHLIFRQVVRGLEAKFYVLPFLFSRQFTVFIWSLRLLHRLWTKTSENDLLLLLGNVERSEQYFERPQIGAGDQQHDSGNQ